MAKKILTQDDSTPQEGVVNLPNGTTLNEPVNVEDLADVNLTSVQGGEALVYDAVAGEWINDSVTVDTSQIEADIDALEGAVATNSADIATNDSNIAANTTAIATNTSKNLEQDGRLDSLEASPGYDDTTLAGRVTQNETDISNLQTDVATNTTNISNNETAIDGKADTVHTHDYATSDHTHDTTHNHDGTYQPAGDYATNTDLTTGLAGKSDTTHDHPEYEGGGGASTLPELTDVTLTSPTDGQSLVYDSATQMWVNETVTGGGGGDTSQIEADVASLQTQANVNTSNIDALQTSDASQNTRLDDLEARPVYDDTALREDVDANTTKNADQDSRLDAIEAGGIPGATSLGQLADVTLASEQDGQALVYDLASNEWVNGSITAFLPDSFQWATASTSFTTNEVAANGITTGSVDMGTTNFQLTKVTTSVPARFRLYLNNDFMTSDLNRAVGDLPIGEHGLITELVTTSSNLDLYLPVSVFGFSAEDPISNSFAWSVQNLDSASASIQVDLEYYMVDTTGTLAGLNLPELKDVTITNVQQGDVITYDSATQEWTNEAVSYDTSGIESDISALQSQVSTNTGNISTNSGNITSLQSQVEQNTSNINVIIQGGAAGGAGSTVWLGTVTAVLNGDQQTVEVAAEAPINGTITAANKTPGFVYVGDKVVGTTTYDLEYVIVSREFNYPDMPAFDPTGGLSQNGADQGKPLGFTISFREDSNGFGPRQTCIAPLDTVNKTVYFQAKNDGLTGREKYIEYRSITDSSLYGDLYLPDGREPFRPLNYAGFLVTGACSLPASGTDFDDSVAPFVYYWDWRVQNWGELVGFDTMLDGVRQTLGWPDEDSSSNNLRYLPPYLNNGRDGKLHALVSVYANSLNKYVNVHATYDYSTDPLSGTWTVQHYKEMTNSNFGLDHKYYNAFTPNYDFTGAGIIERASSTVTNRFYYYWWDFATNGLNYMSNIESTEISAISTTISASDSAKPNSSAAIYQSDDQTTLKMVITDWKTGSESVITLASFPLTKYRMKFTGPGSTYRLINGIFDHINGYFISAIDNYVDGKMEVWKFDLFGQANMIAEYPQTYNWYEDGDWGQHTPAQGIGSVNSYTVPFWSLQSNNPADYLIYWIDVSQ